MTLPRVKTTHSFDIEIKRFLYFRFFPLALSSSLHNLVSKERNRSWDVVSSKETHDTEHGETAIVELPAPLGLKDSWVNFREVELGEDDLRQLSALGVMRSLALSVEFGDEDGANDLSLSGIRDGSPGIRGGHGRKVLE